MINTVSTTTSQAFGTAQPGAAAQSGGLTSDFKTFLKMLTAQARYQDPLEPIDSTEYASQLAQFSMVEQQVKTNDSLVAMLGQLTGTNMAALAGWVGMEARAVTPAYFDGTPVTVIPNPAAVSDRVDLVVFDEAGTEVQRSQIPVSADPIEWAGVDEDGDPFDEGIYSFTVESFVGDDLILNEPAEIYSTITEAQVQDGQVIVILEGGQAILSSSVTGLRKAS